MSFPTPISVPVHRTRGSLGGNRLVGRLLWLLALHQEPRELHSATYGSLAAVIVLLLFLYISDCVLLLGADDRTPLSVPVTMRVFVRIVAPLTPLSHQTS